jgi:uncharacterized protein (DUF2132 family)
MEHTPEKEDQPNNILHNVKLKDMLVYLEKNLGWDEMGKRVRIKCFTTNPTMGSSLNFLRKTPWAKEEVQQLYLQAVKGKLKPVAKKTVKKWPFLK